MLIKTIDKCLKYSASLPPMMRRLNTDPNLLNFYKRYYMYNFLHGIYNYGDGGGKNNKL